ncbi:MAG: hypothetical protein ACKOTZ_13965 [Chloroflexota bacterium]
MRRTSRVAAVLATIALAAVVAFPAGAAKQVKTTICHWDAAEGQYVQVTVPGGLANKGHAKHANDIAFDGDCIPA